MVCDICSFVRSYIHMHTHAYTKSSIEIHIYKYIGYMVLNRFKSNKHNAMECSSLTASLWLNWHTQLVSVEQVKVIVFPFVHVFFSLLFSAWAFLSLHFHRYTFVLVSTISFSDMDKWRKFRKWFFKNVQLKNQPKKLRYLFWKKKNIL